MKLFTLDFINIYYDEKLRLIEYKWKKNSEHITDQQYRETINDLIKIIKTFEPLYVLANLTDQYYALPSDTQKWIIDHALNNVFLSGVKKFALINSQYFLAKNIYQNLLDNRTNVKIFQDRQQAMSWLLNNGNDKQ